jgi:hypothetical protein
MSALDRHVWEVSPAADRVWSQVVGLRPAEAEKRLLMSLRAFIDDSYTDAVYVLAGHVSTAARWAEFAKEWEKLLILTEVKQSETAIAHLPAFWRTMHEHTICSMYLSFRRADLQRAKDRITLFPYQEIDWGKFDSEFTFAFTYLMEKFTQNRHLMADLEGLGPIDFIFDRHSDHRHILDGWEKYVANRPDEIKDHFSSHPRFEDDTKFLPLQAADFFAGFIRCWKEGDLDWMNPQGDAAKSFQLPQLKTINIQATEEHLVDYLMHSVASQLPPNHYVIDAKG